MGWLRDHRFRLALELSVLLHLLLAWLLPQAVALAAGLLPATAQTAALPPPEPESPIRFELVELPDQREEPPARQRAPLSDLSRRAHGGEGDPAERPGVSGTTPDLRLAPPAPAVPPRPQAPRGVPSAADASDAPPVAERSPAGAGDVLVQPRDEERQEPPVLKGLAALRSPGAQPGAAPDRRGGRADLGALSFDTQWYDWGPYAAEMLRRIRYHWQIPEIARLGVLGVTRIHFYIAKTGAVSDLEVLMDAEHPPMTFAARDAILDASPLPPLPADLHSEREGVTITFYYNTRPPEDGGGR
jgi:outer membrane biosynthesis protein TonB